MRFFVVILAMLLVATNSSSAIAASFKEPPDISNKQKAHYNISFTGGTVTNTNDPTTGCSETASTVLTGNDNQEKTYNFLTNSSQGLSPIQAAVVMGNIMTESSFRPDNPPGGFGSASHWGLVQWDTTRQNGLKTYAEGKGSVTDLGVQLGYVWKEASENIHGFNLSTFKGKTTIEEAASYWQNYYEGAPGQADADRLNYAKGFLEKYGGGADSAPIAGGSCLGNDTQFLDGFTVYSQYDRAWVNKPYGSSTIGDSGCGPSAMAMIITALTGKHVTPVETSNYAASKGLIVDGGSSWSIGEILAEHWGLKSEFVGPSVQKINDALGKGGLVIVVGQGSLPFTSGGHFIVIRAATAGGKWLVGDSAHKETNTQEWDPTVLVSQMRDGGEYAIYK